MQPVVRVFAALIFAGLAVPQDLPPGVLLLSRVKAHMKDELHRLTTLTCIETVEREHQGPKGKMRPLDTIRLEVLTNGDKELFASPGDRKFSDNHPISYAGSGFLGDGLFGSYLKNILLSDNIASEYRGEEEIGGRRVARYDYRIPLLISGQTIRTPEGSGRVGLHGSYWADPQTWDVVRLQMTADEFPPSLPVTEMTTTIDYARTRVGNDLIVLLPDTAWVRLAKYSGERDENRVAFTHCRIFGSESTLSFDAPVSPEPAARFGTASVDDTLRPLESGLQIAVKLRTRITGDMAVGTLIDGAVSGSVMVKHTVAIPDGSPVRGRIRRMEHYEQPFSYYVVGLEFTEVEIQAVRHVFYADLLNIDSAPGVALGLSTKNVTTTIVNPFDAGDFSTRHVEENVSLPKLPGVATFFYKGDKLALPPDFRTLWKTLPLK